MTTKLIVRDGKYFVVEKKAKKTRNQQIDTMIKRVVKFSLEGKSLPTEYNLTALHIAVIMRDYNMIYWLFQRGAKFNKRDVFGNTPLYYTLPLNHAHETKGNTFFARTLIMLGSESRYVKNFWSYF